MSEMFKPGRRRFLEKTGLTLAAARLGMFGAVDLKAAPVNLSGLPTIKPDRVSCFDALKQINAGELNVGYAEEGPGNGPVVILLHGWPYDIHSFEEVAPILS